MQLTHVCGNESLYIGDCLQELVDVKKYINKLYNLNVTDLKWVNWYRSLLLQANKNILGKNSYQYGRINSLMIQFGKKLGGIVLKKFNKRFPAPFLKETHRYCSWIMVNKIMHSEVIFKTSFKKSLSFFIKKFGMNINVTDVDIDNIWELLKGRDKFTNNNQFWNEMYATNYDGSLMQALDYYRALSASTTTVERAHKRKHELAARNYKFNSLNTILFINSNVPEYGSSDYYKIIKDATRYFVLLRYSKYKDAIRNTTEND